VEEIELELLLEAVSRRYGYDFKDYARPSIARRVRKAVMDEELSSISALQDRVLHDPSCMERVLRILTINVTAMFRDPSFYAAFREKVVPLLRTYPFVRIWHAGCSTGEEVYSLAILLTEAGIYDRCRIYATDLSCVGLEAAKAGIYRLSDMKEYTCNYQKAGGAKDFSSYYRARYDHAILNNDLKTNLVFSLHNLARDASFNEFNVIVCRNVMIYFNESLQNRVFALFHQSLCVFGVLGLGKKESLRFSPWSDAYEDIDQDARIYRRTR
jgi:chemotaxis protein methyltransferase CheR